MQQLPEPLTLDRLRGHQARPTPTSAEDYFPVIAGQFNLNTDQAADAVQGMLRKNLEESQQQRLTEHLPESWQALFTAA